MRVLYFTEKDTPHDQRFLSALSGTSHEVFALRQFPCSPKLIDGVNELGWGLGQPDWSTWDGWLHGRDQLRELLVSVQPDLVHAGPVQGPALLTALAEFHPLVTMSWGSDLLLHAQRSPWMRYATRFTMERTDVFIGDCQAVLLEAAYYGMLAEKMVSFPWGIDLGHFSLKNGEPAGQKLRHALGWEDKFIVFCNRNWSGLYRVDLLAKAFVLAVKENKNLRLFLAGKGPQAELIHKLLAPVEKYVRNPGWLDLKTLPEAYCAADLFVNPSHSDGSAISMLEAMACEIPVLASGIPGNREWVSPDVGSLFRDGDVQSLKKGLLRMAADPALGQYGKAARLVVEERANWQRNFQKLLAAYELACVPT